MPFVKVFCSKQAGRTRGPGQKKRTNVKSQILNEHLFSIRLLERTRLTAFEFFKLAFPSTKKKEKVSFSFFYFVPISRGLLKETGKER